MVNKTFFKECFRAIRGSLSRFLAIFLIVALGAGFLAGLLATTPDMRHSVSLRLQEDNLFDIRVSGNLGMEQGDALALSQVEGVSAVMPARSVDREIALASGDTVVGRFHGVTAWEGDDPALMNRQVLVEGRWPQTDSECVVMEENELYRGVLTVGQKLQLLPPEAPDDPDEEPDEPFLIREFTIVGVVHSGYYLSAVQRGATRIGNGKLGAIVFVQDSVLDMDYYTDIFLTVEGAMKAGAFTDGYESLIQPVQQRVEALAETQKHVRGDRLIGDAREELEEARQELADKTAEGEQELADALIDLQEGEQEYADGVTELEEGKQELKDALADLQEGEQELADALIDLQEGEQEYADGLKDIAEAEQEIADGEQELADGFAEIQKGRRELEKARKELEQAEEKLARGSEELREGKQQLADGQKQLDAAYAQLADGQKQLDAGKAQLDAGQAQLDSARKELDTQQAQLEAANAGGMLPPGYYDIAMGQIAVDRDQLTAQQSQLDAGKAQLNAQQTQLDAGKAQLDQQQAQLDEGRDAMADGKQQLADGRAEIAKGWADYEQGLTDIGTADAEWRDGLRELEKGKQELADGKQELADARTELDDGWKDYEQGKRDLADGWQEYSDGLSDIAEAEQELADGRIELDDGWQDYREGKLEFEEKIADANDKIREAQEQIDDIEEPDWYVLRRSEGNEGYIFYDSDTQKVSAVARVFPIFFCLVAALVASTTMTRMIDEDRGAIGTLKALGYSNTAVAGKYLLYAMLACVLGAAVGLSVFLPLFPRIIANAYRMMYLLPPIRSSNHLPFILMSAGGILIAVLLATLGALRGSLKDTAAQLMRPKAPPAGKRILLERIRPLWRRMKFTHKVTARNLFRYKKRFFMTVIGIAGCTALLVAGFGLRDSIGDIAGVQFTQLQTYEMTLSLDRPGDHIADRKIAAVLADGSRVLEHLPVHMESGKGVSDDHITDLYLLVPSDTGRFTDYHNLRQRVGQAPVPFTEEGAVLTEKAARMLGISPGDTLTLRNQDDAEAAIPITGICENYVQGYVFLPRAVYEQAYGGECAFDTLLVKTVDMDGSARDRLAADLLDSDNVTGVSFSAATIETFDDMLGSIDYIVILLIVAAAALAFVVLYNLTNINICERQKEIATLKVLGFYKSEVTGYVFRETVLLSLLGSGTGLVIGKFFHRFVVETAETDAAMFGRTVYPASYGYAFALSLLFTLLVSLALKSKLKSIDMVESLKAPE